MIRPLVVLAIVTIVTANSPAIMVIDGFSSNQHDRFANNASFVGGTSDFSGVGRTSNFWATMISPQVFLSADHFHPAINSTVAFYATNDPSSTPVTRTVSTGMQLGATDIWVGLLDSSLPPSIAHYPVAAPIPPGPVDDAADYDGSVVFHVGDSNAQLGSTRTTDFRVGRNVLDLCCTTSTLSGGQVTTFAGYIDDTAAGSIPTGTAAPNLLSAPTDETFFQTNDSGGPTFIANPDGSLTLLGIHSFISDLGSLVPPPELNPDRRFSGDSYLPTYASGIAAKAASIPEPSAFFFLAVGIALTSVGRSLYQGSGRPPQTRIIHDLPPHP